MTCPGKRDAGQPARNSTEPGASTSTDTSTFTSEAASGDAAANAVVASEGEAPQQGSSEPSARRSAVAQVLAPLAESLARHLSRRVTRSSSRREEEEASEREREGEAGGYKEGEEEEEEREEFSEAKDELEDSEDGEEEDDDEEDDEEEEEEEGEEEEAPNGGGRRRGLIGWTTSGVWIFGGRASADNDEEEEEEEEEEEDEDDGELTLFLRGGRRGGGSKTKKKSKEAKAASERQRKMLKAFSEHELAHATRCHSAAHPTIARLCTGRGRGRAEEKRRRMGGLLETGEEGGSVAKDGREGGDKAKASGSCCSGGSEGEGIKSRLRSAMSSISGSNRHAEGCAARRKKRNSSGNGSGSGSGSGSGVRSGAKGSSRGSVVGVEQGSEGSDAWQRVNVAQMIAAREANCSGRARFSLSDRCHLSQRFIPTDGPSVIDRVRSRAYIGRFSADGGNFIAGFQDRRIRVYNVDMGWQLRKDVIARNLRWTITDTALSPDQRFLVYASINPVVHLVDIGYGGGGAVRSLANITDIHEELHFEGRDDAARRSRGFGIWSLQFSSDGREVVAGTSDHSLCVFDVERNEPVLHVRAHGDDVNAVAFADDKSNLIFTGSDDRLCKVWDRRLLGSSSPPSSGTSSSSSHSTGTAWLNPRRALAQPVGILPGHCEGITHIDAKGDGLHFISNGKDQTAKLWDIRKMMGAGEYQSLPRLRIPEYQWDYRWMDYPGDPRTIRHPHDRSLMTYCGHKVLQTLIRCYFSPAHSTAQRFIYSGSHDGCVYIYDLLTGEQVAKLSFHDGAVRDVSWHPHKPQIASVSWDGRVALWHHLRGERPTADEGSLKPIPECLLDDRDDMLDDY